MYRNSFLTFLCKVLVIFAIIIALFESASLYFKSEYSGIQRTLQIINKDTYSKISGSPVDETVANAKYHSSTEQTQPEVLRWNGQAWIKWNDFCQDEKVKNYSLADLHAPSGHMPFYVHDSKHDSYTSRIIFKSHTYEKSDLELMYRHLLEDKTMGLVDIGSHVGLYSATAALMGRKVVTVDALYMNMHAWCHSVVRNKFSDNVLQVYTIMSNEHRLMYFKTEGIHIGGTTVHIAEDQNKKVSPFDKNFIHAATLDDLLHVVTFQKVFMKIDVEKHELEVISGGGRFFKELDVKYVLMEWIHHDKGENRNKIVNLMTSYGFKGFTTGPTEEEVDFNKHRRLYNILWKKEK